MNRQERTEKILEASLKVFAKYGFKKTTVEDIATALSMTKGNLYLYARDKRDLYEKTVAFGLRRWQRNVIQSVANIHDIVEKTIVICKRSYEYLAKDEDMRNVIINDPSIFPLHPEEDHFYRINVESMDVLKTLIHRGVEEKRFRPINADHLTSFIYSVYIMFVHKTYVKLEGPMVDEMFNAALDVILKGLLVPEHPENVPYLADSVPPL